MWGKELLPRRDRIVKLEGRVLMTKKLGVKQRNLGECRVQISKILPGCKKR